MALSFRLYPRSYRKDFGEEMHSVYTQAALDAEQSGFLAWLFFLTREIRGVIPALIREYGLVFLRGEKQMLILDGIENGVPDEHSLQPGESHRWATLLAGSAIFVLWGLDAIVSEIAFSVNEP